MCSFVWLPRIPLCLSLCPSSSEDVWPFVPSVTFYFELFAHLPPWRAFPPTPAHLRPGGTNTNIIFTSFNLMRGSMGAEGGGVVGEDEVGTGGQGGRIKNMANFVVCFCFTFYFTCCWRPGVLPCVRPAPGTRLASTPSKLPTYPSMTANKCPRTRH